MLVDTHCHLHDREFFSAKQAGEILERALKKGVEKIICIGTNPEDSMSARDFAKAHQNVFWTYGTHPNETNSKSLFKRDEKLVAIGEVGLDYHYEDYDRDRQIELFEQMLQLAQDNNLPVSFHVREAFDDFFPIIENFPKIRGVVHSFSDNKRNLKRILDETDFFIGVNGMATYSTLPTPPLNRILLETDAPFLAPAPFRNTTNEPGYIYEIANWLSDKLKVNFSQVESETTKNAHRLFGI